jgi:hypothetical protein
MIAFCAFLGILNIILASYTLSGNILGVTLSSICFFIVNEAFGTPVLVYMVEITNNTVYGAYFFAALFIGFLWGVVQPFIVTAIGPAALLFIFGAIVLLLNLPFVLIFNKETVGLTDKEKKELYMKK